MWLAWAATIALNTMSAAEKPRDVPDDGGNDGLTPPLPAIPEIDTIEEQLVALESTPDVRRGAADKTDLPDDPRIDLVGEIHASGTVKVQQVRHWKQDASPYSVAFSGAGLVRLTLPEKGVRETKVGEDVLFITLSIKPALASDPNRLSYVSVAGALLAFGVEPPTMGIRAGRFFVLNGDAESARRSDWVNGRVSFPVNENYEATIPLDFMVRIDAKRSEWDLFFRQNLRYAGIHYRGQQKDIWLNSPGEKSTEISELSVTAFNPLFEDRDVDGIDDLVETELGFSPDANDRHALDELGQFTNLQHFVGRRRIYASRRQVELEATLIEVIAARQAGRGLGELESQAIPEDQRSYRFSKEEWEQKMADTQRKNRQLAVPAPDSGRPPEGEAP